MSKLAKNIFDPSGIFHSSGGGKKRRKALEDAEEEASKAFRKEHLRSATRRISSTLIGGQSRSTQASILG